MATIDEKVLWDAANKLIGAIAPVDYMNVTMGLIFLKYVSDKYEVRYQELLETGKDVNDKDYYEMLHIYLIPENARWNFIKDYTKSDYIDEHGKEFNLGQLLDNAFIQIEAENPEFKGILPKVFSKSDIDKRRLGEVVDLFTNQLIFGDADQDFVGRVYEYFMGKFSNLLGKGGEFFTPRSIVKLLVAILDPKDGKVYDPCCGTGGMFVSVGEFVATHQGNVDAVSVYGQELNPQTWRLAKMNLAIRGIEANIGDSFGDTFHNDKHKNLRANYVLANPPFNIKDYGQPALTGDPRWKFGTPPSGNANYAWIQHMYSKLAPNGKAGFVLANGSLSTSSKQEYEIRKNMLEAGVVDCIITMPTNLFFNVTIPVALWFLKEGKKSKDVLFIDARNMGHMIDRKVRELSQEDIDKLSTTHHNWINKKDYEDVKGFCKVASIEEIREADYTLVPGRYVGVDDSNKMSQEEIQAEIKKTSLELLKLFEESEDLEKKVKELLMKNVSDE